MIFVAVVESEEVSVDQLKERLNSWIQKRSISSSLVIRIFSTGEEFLKSELDDYQAVFMAIKLAGSLNGIETARYLRDRGYSTPVIYTTHYKEHVFEGYKVDAFDFLIKPVSSKQIEQCMDRIMESVMTGAYTIQTKTSVQKIPYNEIMYIQSFNHYVEIHTAGKDYKHLISLSKVVQKLPIQFSRCHRTMIINLNYAKGILGAEVGIKDGQHFPISASYFKDFRESFLKNHITY